MIDRLIVTADLHLRDKPYKNDLALSMDVLEDLATIARREGSEFVVIAGDLFHDKVPSHRLLIDTYNKLRDWRDKGVTFIWLRGNHDHQIKSEPHLSIMTMFDEVCVTVIKPYIMENDHQMLFFAPWYSGEEFKDLLKHYARTAAGNGKQKILFGHTAMAEGLVSTTYKMNQPIKAADFCEDLYDLILLGDYHLPHEVTPKIRYVGVPVPRNFGDKGENYHPWLLNLGGGKSEMLPMQMMRPFPRYMTYKKHKYSIIPGYNPRDRNRIVCTPSVAEELYNLYPGADYEYVDEERAETTSMDRLKDVEVGDNKSVWQEFCVAKGYSKEIIKIGMKFI